MVGQRDVKVVSVYIGFQKGEVHEYAYKKEYP